MRALVSEEAAGDRVAEGEEDEGAVRLFVGLPADAVVSDGRGVSCPRAVSAALHALKLLGVDGIELLVFWPPGRVRRAAGVLRALTLPVSWARKTRCQYPRRGTRAAGVTPGLRA